MSGRTARWVRLVALGLTAAAVGLAGCGDEGDNATDPDAYATGAPTKAVFCAAIAKIEAPFLDAGNDAGDGTVEAAKKVVDLLNDTSKAAPTDIQDAANTRLTAIRAAAEGDASKLREREAVDAARRIKDYCSA